MKPTRRKVFIIAAAAGMVVGALVARRVYADCAACDCKEIQFLAIDNVFPEVSDEWNLPMAYTHGIKALNCGSGENTTYGYDPPVAKWRERMTYGVCVAAAFVNQLQQGISFSDDNPGPWHWVNYVSVCTVGG